MLLTLPADDELVGEQLGLAAAAGGCSSWRSATRPADAAVAASLSLQQQQQQQQQQRQ
jgi:hypothetical protein